jgi:hypothetical protein
MEDIATMIHVTAVRIIKAPPGGIPNHELVSLVTGLPYAYRLNGTKRRVCQWEKGAPIARI